VLLGFFLAIAANEGEHVLGLGEGRGTVRSAR
jgi:hypothetical protein